MTDTPFPTENLDDYAPEKQEPEGFELRTTPKPVLSINKYFAMVAVGAIIALFIFIVSYAFSKSSNESTVTAAQKPEPTLRSNLNDLYQDLPTNYRDAANYIKEKQQAMLDKRKKEIEGRITNGSSNAVPDESLSATAQNDLLNICLALLAEKNASSVEYGYCKDIVAASYNLQNDSPMGLPSTASSTGKHNGYQTNGAAGHTTGSVDTTMAPMGNQEAQPLYSEEEIKAWESDILVDTGSAKTGVPTSSPVDSLSEDIAALGNIELPDLSAGMGQADSASTMFAQNAQERKQRFLQGGQEQDVYLEHQLETPRSPYQVMAGTMIPIVMTQGINSDLPGQVSAQVREHVYDTVTGRFLLVPQGTKIIGRYDSVISYGQERILVVWNRMIMPNGSSIVLDGMPGVDLSGLAGIGGDVNNHWGRIITGVVLSSMLSVGAATSKGDQDNETFSQDLARAIGGEISETGKSILERNVNIQPTIVVKPGESANILVNKDMVLKPYIEKKKHAYSETAKRDW